MGARMPSMPLHGTHKCCDCEIESNSCFVHQGVIRCVVCDCRRMTNESDNSRRIIGVVAAVTTLALIAISVVLCLVATTN